MLYIAILILIFPFEIYQLQFNGYNIRYYDIFCVIIFINLIIIKIIKSNKIKIDIVTKSIFCITLIGLISSLIFSTNLFLSSKTFFSYSIIVLSCIIYSNEYKVNYYIKIDRIIIIISLFVAVFVNIQFFGYVLEGTKINFPFCNYLKCSDVVYTDGFGAYGYLGGLMRPTGFFISMNRVGTYLIPALVLSLDLLLRNKKFIYLIIFLIFIETILISLARNSIIAALIAIIIYLNYSYKLKLNKNKNKYKYIYIYIFIIFSLIFVALNPLKLEALEHFNIFDIDARSDISNSLNFLQHLTAITEININNFGFGLGFQEYDEYVFINNMVDTYGAHNNFLTIFGESGFFAIIIYIFIAIYAYNKVHNCTINKSVVYTYFSIYFSLFVSGFFRTYYFNPFSFYFLVVLLAEIKNHNDSNINNKL
jgi:hypothetical protein